MDHEERTQFVREQIESEWLLSRRRVDREDVIRAIVEAWEADLTAAPGVTVTIDDFSQVHDLPQHQVVRDAAGRVWCVVKPKSAPDDTWLVPFSDEYAYIISAESTALGIDPELPLTDLGITSTGGG